MSPPLGIDNATPLVKGYRSRHLAHGNEFDTSFFHDFQQDKLNAENNIILLVLPLKNNSFCNRSRFNRFERSV